MAYFLSSQDEKEQLIKTHFWVRQVIKSVRSVAHSPFLASIYIMLCFLLLSFYHKCCNLIGYATRYLFRHRKAGSEGGVLYFKITMQ